jgi:putative DNA primase/helicase
VWGGGAADGKNRFIRTWQSTAVGIEACACLHSDTLAVLDELHLVEPRVLDSAAYALANGCGKSRGNVYANMRPTKHWRVFGLSSGEVSCDTWLRSGGITVRAGQSVRVLDVPVHGSYGAFEDLHGFLGGKSFSEQLNRNALRCYGHAGPVFVRTLIEENPDLVKFLDTIVGCFSPSKGKPPLNPIQSRAARTFAIMAVAGELAALWGIVPWEKEEAIQSCVLLFRHWLKQIRANGSESPEARILEMVASYIDRFGDSRFSNFNGDDREVRIIDRSGWWKLEHLPVEEEESRQSSLVNEDPGYETRRIYLFTPSGMKEATRGHDLQAVAAALKGAGALVKEGADGRHAAALTTLPTGTRNRLYHVDPKKLRR